MTDAWMHRAVRAMNDAVVVNHHNHHNLAVHFADCALGTCGQINPLIGEAQHEGIRPNGVPDRRR